MIGTAYSHPFSYSDARLAFLQAIESNNLIHASALLRQGIDVNQKDPLGYTPLMLAAGRGNVQMVELLLTAGADVFILDSRMGASALHKAAQSGVVDGARLLLQRGAFLDLQAPTNGLTPLITAVWHKRVGMVAYLVSQGANLRLQMHAGETALEIARRDQLTDIVHILEKREQTIRELVERQALHTAVRAIELETVRRLLRQGADVNEKAPIIGSPDDAHTPLMIAARQGYEDIVRELLAAGANPHIVDWLMKATPGHKAAYMGHPGVLRLLVEHGGLELDAQGPYNGYTALHDAIWHGHTEAAQVLLDAGAMLDLKGHEGYTPLEMAKAYGYHEIVTRLEAKQQELESL